MNRATTGIYRQKRLNVEKTTLTHSFDYFYYCRRLHRLHRRRRRRCSCFCDAHASDSRRISFPRDAAPTIVEWRCI